MSTTTIALLFLSVSQQLGLPPGLLSAVCWQESKHVAKAVHPDDGGHTSVGVCQLQWRTAHFMGYKGTEQDLFNPEQNIRFAGKYLRYQLRRHPNDLPCAIASYNAGHCMIAKDGDIVNDTYVEKVLEAWEENK